jgi:hypothetical protein
LKDHAKFVKEVHIPLSEWSAAYDLCLSKTVKYCEVVESDTISVYVTSKRFDSTKGQFNDLVKKYRSFRKGLSWKSFDSFSDLKKKLRIVVLNQSNWLTSSCNCSIFQKQYCCKHVLFVAVLYKLTSVPPEAKTIDICRNSGKGAHSKATPALTKQ